MIALAGGRRDPRRLMLEVMPRDRTALRGWLRLMLDVQTPGAALVAGHDPPLEYLWHALDEGTARMDAVVWAARGSGKTFYAAVATLLDLLFKPGIEVRILGGSLEQSQRMHEHLRRLLERPALRGAVDGRPTARRVRLVNGSVCEIMAQSQTSVRGTRPQKLRCDEVELFDPDVWRAAQLVTRSKVCGGRLAQGAVEALSTWHRPGGLMSELVGEALLGAGGRRLFRWGVVDVLERCPAARACAGCALWPECGGRAKAAGGHVAIDDAITMKRRSDAATWESEMLCLRPQRSDAVFPEFDPALHVVDDDPAAEAMRGMTRAVGIDFGFRAPTVLLWAVIDDDAAGGVVRVVDERVAAGVTLQTHVEAIRAARWGMPSWVGVDPAGEQRHEQTGWSNATQLRRAGLMVRARRMGLEEGLRLVRARLAPASGPVRLLIHRRCARLIESLQRYRYPSERPESRQPVKDGADHAADALRYLIVNADRPYRTRVSRG